MKRKIRGREAAVTDISKLVEDLNAGIRAGGKKLFDETVYRDTPILRVASSLPGGEPPEYRQMRRLGATFDRGLHTESRIFYEQAKFMADFTDTFPETAPFRSFYPTYRIMSLPQQRTYFTWRTRLRAGDLKKIDVSYVFIYVFELLNLAGVSSPEEAFGKLLAFYRSYRALDPVLDNYMPEWLRDFVVYYGLDKALLAGIADNTFDEHVAVLLRPEEADDETLFAAMQALSTVRAENSRFYRERTADFVAVSAAVYRRMNEYHAEHRKTSYCESLFGRLRTAPYAIFSSAVFYDCRRFENRSYEFGPFHRYVCADGRWQCTHPPGGGEKSKALGAFFRNIDAFLREACDYPYELKPAECTKQFETLAKKEIAAFIARKKEAERRVVTIDFSALDRIRAASEATREKILTDEERDETPAAEAEQPLEALPAAVPAQPPEPGAPGAPVTQAVQNAGADTPLSALSETETAFLRLVAAGEDPAAFCRSTGLMPSVLADEINEKLFDTFADTVIDFSSDAPEIVPDYAEDVSALLSAQ